MKAIGVLLKKTIGPVSAMKLSMHCFGMWYLYFDLLLAVLVCIRSPKLLGGL